MGFAWCIAHLVSSGASLLTQVFSENPISYAISTMGILMFICLLLVLFAPQLQKEKDPSAEAVDT